MILNFYSHACVRIEDAGKSIICDPWLVGDTFWGAWRLTPNACIAPENLSCDYIAISHWHFDHLNLPSLKRINKDIPILIPKFPITWMRQTLKKLGFHHIIELNHGERFEIGNDISIVMYQCQYQDDCVIVFHGQTGDIVNLNDAKPLKSLMNQIKSSCKNTLATLRSHSYAWSYPTRFIFESGDSIAIDDNFYIKKFYSDSSFFKPKAMIGFASGVSHPIIGFESENFHLVTFDHVKNFVATNFSHDKTPLFRGKSGAKLTYLNDSWVYEDEFLTPLPYENLSEQICVVNHRGSYESTLRTLNKFFQSTRIFSHFKSFRYRVGFFDPDGRFLIGFDSSCGVFTNLSGRLDVEYYVNETVLHDSFKKNIFTNIDISKLWTVKILDQLKKHFIFTGLFALYEHGYFRSRNVFNKRFISQWFYRRHEIFDYLKMILKALFSRKSFAEVFSEIT